jgi:hypothetical protein
MLGFKPEKKEPDSLPVLVNIIQDAETFTLVQKVWANNQRNIRQSPANHKEFLRFGLVESKQAVWLERDMGRNDASELILTWMEENKSYYDVYAVVPSSSGVTSGDSSYAKEILVALLTTPATLPVEQQK